MTMTIEIRRASVADAKAVSDVVLRAVQMTNARDYPASVVDRLAATLPKKVASNLKYYDAYVAIVDGQIVGTGSLNGQIVSSVFVDPDHQGRGVGSQLMDAIENAALRRPGEVLVLQSSITAQPFYTKRGFKIVREAFDGEERTIHMAKDIKGRVG